MPMPDWKPPLELTAAPGGKRRLLEAETAQVAEQVIGGHVVGDVEVDAVVVVEVGRDDAQPATVRVDEARRLR